MTKLFVIFTQRCCFRFARGMRNNFSYRFHRLESYLIKFGLRLVGNGSKYQTIPPPQKKKEIRGAKHITCNKTIEIPESTVRSISFKKRVVNNVRHFDYAVHTYFCYWTGIRSYSCLYNFIKWLMHDSQEGLYLSVQHQNHMTYKICANK